MVKSFYWFAYWVVRIYLKIFRGLTIYGLENFPKTGPVVVAGNHVSNFDPPVLGVSLNRPCRFLAKKELFLNSFSGGILRALGAFPIDRGKADLEAIKTSIRVLKEGEPLMVFPEGTRHKPGQLGQAQPGIVNIAIKGQASILPCALTNTHGGRPIVVRIGKLIDLSSYFERKISKEEAEELANRIMEEIAKLLEQDRYLLRKMDK